MILHNNNNHTKNKSEKVKPWGTIKIIYMTTIIPLIKNNKATPIGAGGDKQNFMEKRCTK